MTGRRYSPFHVTEFCGEMQDKFKVGLAQLIIKLQHRMPKIQAKFKSCILADVERHIKRNGRCLRYFILFYLNLI